MHQTTTTNELTSSVTSCGAQPYSTQIQYSPELDGLRALAVAAVLLFHVGVTQLSGGYVGVDVFFVLSGYLITGILIRDMERERFSYLVFLSKRIARLYPALVATLLGCLLLGFLFLAPAHYAALAKSTVTSFFSTSNFEFWRGAGYFDTSSETNPLLHTWSLGVEQQFYLLWPLVLLVGVKLWKSGLLRVVIAAAFVSLLFSEWFTVRDPSANYFLMPFRMFEFAIGASLIWLQRYEPEENPLLEVLLALGIALIAYSVVAFDANTAFPGFNALIPAIGAALCIFSRRAKYVGMLLRNRLAVFLGVLSYSLYLVHWPAIVFYKYYVFRPLGIMDRTVLLVICLVLATLLHRYVEQKYRRVNLLDISARSFAAAAFTVLAVLVPSAIIYAQQGLPFRTDQHAMQRNADIQEFHKQEYGGAGYPAGGYDIGAHDKAPSALILGDSYARQYAASLDKLASELGVSVHTAFQDGCFFSKKYTALHNGSLRKDCFDRTAYALKVLQENPDIPLIFAASWANRVAELADADGNRLEIKPSEGPSFIVSDIQHLMNAAGVRPLILIGISPGAPTTAGLMACLARPKFLPSTCVDRLSVAEKDGNGYAVNQALSAFAAENPNIEFLNTYAALCHEGKCPSLIDHQIVYSDSSHLSRDGAQIVFNQFASELSAALLKQPM